MKQVILWVTFTLCSVANLFAGDTAYLFSYFINDSKDGLHLAYSYDGLHWTALNGGRSYLTPTVGKDKLMRDPSICQSPDGTFHMVWTSSWTDRIIGYSSSRDLIHWSEQKAIPVMMHEPTAHNCWAPELFYDEPSKTYYIFWATTIPGRHKEIPTSESEKGLNHRIYYVTTKDFITFSETKMFFNPDFSVIDAAIVKDPQRKDLIMVVKNENSNPPEKNLRITRTKKIGKGFSTHVSAPITGKYWAEGPAPLFVGDTLYVYFDKYREHRYGAVRSLDHGKTWEDVSEQVSFPRGIRHGTAFSVDVSVVDALRNNTARGVNYETVEVKAPFPMQPIKVFIYPNKNFPITDFGAVSGGEVNNTKAIAAAIEACNKAGGGRVVIPTGTWLTGPIHFKSNVNLHLEENAVLSFTDNPSDYLPAVMTSWEGMECYNYSPLLYAFECENVAISGKGTLQPKMGTWKGWFKRPKPHMDALKELYTKASTDVPVTERQMATGENHLRPHLIHFNRCKNVQLDGFKIRESPFWTIHLYLCDGGVVRNLDVKAHGHNNDGIDFEMSRNFLVEDCSFDQGDDAVVIKAGRNQDAWRLNTPCENIVIRNCEILKGHTLLGIGSEISGGIRNVYMHDCTAPNSVMRLFFVKTNHRRGGFIENIYMKNVKAGTAQRVLEIDTEVLYQWKDLVPTYEKRITKIEGIHMDNVACESADAVYELKGNAELPVKNVTIKNVEVGKVKKFGKKVTNVENVIEENVVYQMEKLGSAEENNAAAGELSGKRIAVIGDSYVKNHKEPVENTWHYKFAKKHNMQYLNYGRNGNSIAYTSPRWGKAMYLRYQEMADNLDYIVVIGGHNDAFKLDSIGGIDIFKDKMEILCKGLVEKYPTAKIFFFTRWNCKNFKGSDSEKVVDAMIEVCGNYSIPIFDCARKGGIYADNDKFRSIYFQKSKDNKDTAHLNGKGHDRFLKVAENFLLRY